MNDTALISIIVTSVICAYGLGDLIYTILYCRTMDRHSSAPSGDSMVGLWVAVAVLVAFWVGGVSTLAVVGS